jgi:hypothetical protein
MDLGMFFTHDLSDVTKSLDDHSIQVVGNECELWNIIIHEHDNGEEG